MNLELLIATMHQKDFSLLERINIESDVIVVNQCDGEGREEFKYRNHNIIWINTKERGLSRSRNMALKNSTADICLIVDEDEELETGYKDTILNSFETIDNADLIGFQVTGIESVFKIYKSSKVEKIGYIRSMKMASVEIAFKRKPVIDNKILFNTLIGAGTIFGRGEENAFLFECLSKKLNVFYVPKLIAKVHTTESTWFRGFNEEYFYTLGAAYTAMSKKMSIILILQFFIRKKFLCKEVGQLTSLKLMLKGRKDYLKLYLNNK